MHRSVSTAACLVLLGAAAPALAQEGTPVAIGLSGWTGFGPLTLASEAGLFEANGLDVTLRKIPQKDRHLAIASGDIQCAATTVETWIVWNAAGVATKQLFLTDRSHGADGMVVRNDIASIADLKGKTVAASAPGTAPYFTLAWMLSENGLSLQDVDIVNLEPAAAAQAFVAGQNDAAMTYEPYLSTVRAAPDAGRIIATTIDYPMVIDSFGCTPDFIEEHPEAVEALITSFFQALDKIEADPDGSYAIMGADVQQTAEQYGQSASFLEYQDKAANQAFFRDEYPAFVQKAADLLLQAGIIREIPDLDAIADTSFVSR
ncbi:ABC transporter substrate-binding protein [Marinivivus vitaminiproducens]|nr:ABC transporter substrate-binding protein [Geminicoccaceae bacterium SCSIO 64248]